MINYYIEDSHKFNYYTDSDTPIDAKITVLEHNVIVYVTEITLSKDVTYFTHLTNGWNDKKIIILNTISNDEITFDMPGEISKLTESQKIKFNKYCKYIILSDVSELCDIMNKQGSDKASKPINSGSAGHNYTRYYSQIFEKFRYDEINLFELGLGTNNLSIESNMGETGVPGASIFGWQEYFKNGHIFGADVDTGCLFNTDKIKTFFCDQTNPWIIRQMWNNKYLDFNFDIIIEDGLHTFNSNVIFFENSYYKLKKHGIYIIEDIYNEEIPNWLNKFDEYEIKFPQFNFELIQLECNHNVGDNNLIKITYK